VNGRELQRQGRGAGRGEGTGQGRQRSAAVGGCWRLHHDQALQPCAVDRQKGRGAA
jgi:hypothetical protein